MARWAEPQRRLRAKQSEDRSGRGLMHGAEQWFVKRDLNYHEHAPRRNRGLNSLVPRGCFMKRSLCFILIVLTLNATDALAASGVVSLGKPTETQSTAVGFPVSGFHRGGKPLNRSGLPELLFIGTQADVASAAERWPLVKALNQFGTLSGVQPSTSDPGFPFPLVPTFDLSHARYHSRYLVVDHVDLLDRDNHPFQHLSAAGRSLYNHYSRAAKTQFLQDPDHAKATIFSGPDTTRQLPLIAIGGYLQTVSQVMIPGDFAQTVALQPGNATSATKVVPYSFDVVQAALIRSQDPTQSHLVEDVNAEANIITALICRATGKRPTSVCNRSVIKAILRHVK